MRYDARGLPVYPWMRGDVLGADELNAAFDGHVLRGGDTMLGPLTLAADPTGYMDAATKEYVDARVGTASIVYADTPPPGPLLGQFWWDTAGLQLYIWYNDGNSTQWVPTNSVSPVASVGTVPVSATAPVGAGQGQLWWDSNDGQLYVRYDDGSSQQWVVANNTLGNLGGPFLPTDLVNAANDAAAASAGVAVHQMYRNGSVLMVRVT